MAAERVEALEKQMEDVEDKIIGLRTDMTALMGDISEQKKELLDSLNLEFAKMKITLNEIVLSAQTEFDTQRAAIQSLYDEMMKNPGTENGNGQKGYIPTIT